MEHPLASSRLIEAARDLQQFAKDAPSAAPLEVLAFVALRMLVESHEATIVALAHIADCLDRGPDVRSPSDGDSTYADRLVENAFGPSVGTLQDLLAATDHARMLERQRKDRIVDRVRIARRHLEVGSAVGGHSPVCANALVCSHDILTKIVEEHEANYPSDDPSETPVVDAGG